MNIVTVIKDCLPVFTHDQKYQFGVWEDKKVVVSIAKYTESRSKRQNAYYWGVVVKTIMEFSKDINGVEYSKEEVHLYILDRVIGRKPVIVEIFGQSLISYEDVSTSKMNTIEFADFILKIQQYFAEMGIIIPDPEFGRGLNMPI